MAVLILALLVCGVALGACAARLRETIPDAPAAVAAAARLCNWTSVDNLHAELLGGTRWHVWDDGGERDAFVNRYDIDGTYVCVTL